MSVAMSDPIFNRYLEANVDAKKRWKAFKVHDYKRISECPVVDELVPLFGTPDFDFLSAEQKRTLFLEFIKHNAEALLIFEQLLLLAFRTFQRKVKLDGPALAALKQLTYEEYLHSKAFRIFLRNEPAFDWPQKGLMVHMTWARSCLLWLARSNPLILPLWGTKAEAFSVYYAQYLKKCFGSWEDNQWSKLHHLHVMDEAHHLNVQLDLYQSGYPLSRINTGIAFLLSFYLFVGFIQCLLFGGCWNMIRSAFPNHTVWQRLGLTLKTARWTVRKFEPYTQARMRTKALYLEKKPALGRWISFIYW